MLPETKVWCSNKLWQYGVFKIAQFLNRSLTVSCRLRTRACISAVFGSAHRKWSGRSTSLGHKAHSTSKCLPSRCTDPPRTKDHSSWTCSSKKALNSPLQSGSQFRPLKASSHFRRLSPSCYQIESERIEDIMSVLLKGQRVINKSNNQTNAHHWFKTLLNKLPQLWREWSDWSQTQPPSWIGKPPKPQDSLKSLSHGNTNSK